MPWDRPATAAAAALFLFVFFAHGVSPSATSSDTHWVVPQMLSILRAGDTNLDEYPELLRQHRYGGVDCVAPARGLVARDTEKGCPGAHYYVYYPLGTTLVSLPVFLAMDASLRVAGPPVSTLLGPRITPVIGAFFRRDYMGSYALVEMVIASFIVALATVFVFATAREFLPLRRAVLLALLFAFGTAAWSTASRALWQHGPYMLALAVALYLFVRAERNPALIPWTGVPVMFAYFIRPTGMVLVGAMAAYVFFHHRGRFVKWALAAAAVAAPFLVYYASIYGIPLPPYYTHHNVLAPVAGNAGRFLSAFAGQGFSPSRGMFVFSPFLLFSVAGIVLAWRRRWQTPLAWYLAAVLLLHWVLISAFADWTAGFCFGPRYFSDVLPIFLFFLIPVAAAYRPGATPPALVAGFAVCALFSVFVHFRGAADWDVQRWNGTDVNPARAWDWSDPQFLHGLGKRPLSRPGP